ncbi:MAG TPA: nucleoside 2-deoxyribosyltransferase domain-containing protein [Verrucomicrobiae bacterium]
MSRILQAPEPIPAGLPRPVVFLAGSIDDGQAQNWQTAFGESFAADSLVLLNPRRSVWPGVTEPVALQQQIDWELHGLERADVIAMYITAESKAPVSLLEFGLWARSGKLVVACEPGYWRRENLAATCARYHVPLVTNLTELQHLVREAVKAFQTFKPITTQTGKFLSMIKEGHWEYAHRTNSRGAAVIVGITDERQILLVEQYRIPVHGRTIELPAGMIGDDPGQENEANAEAARRELLEETGYLAAKIEVLTHGSPCAGLSSELTTMFLATGLQAKGKGGGVGHEDIQVHVVPLNEAAAWLEAKSKAGILVDPKIYAGLYLVGLRMKKG